MVGLEHVPPVCPPSSASGVSGVGWRGGEGEGGEEEEVVLVDGVGGGAGGAGEGRGAAVAGAVVRGGGGGGQWAGALANAGRLGEGRSLEKKHQNNKITHFFFLKDFKRFTLFTGSRFGRECLQLFPIEASPPSTSSSIPPPPPPPRERSLLLWLWGPTGERIGGATTYLKKGNN